MIARFTQSMSRMRHIAATYINPGGMKSQRGDAVPRPYREGEPAPRYSALLCVGLALLVSARRRIKTIWKKVDFSQDPGQFTAIGIIPNPPLKTVKQDFGYRTTTKPVKGAGEIGGRHSGRRRRLGMHFTDSDQDAERQALGFRKIFGHVDDNGNGFCLDFSNTDSMRRAKNSLLFRLDGNGMKYWVFYEYGTQHWLAGELML